MTLPKYLGKSAENLGKSAENRGKLPENLRKSAENLGKLPENRGKSAEHFRGNRSYLIRSNSFDINCDIWKRYLITKTSWAKDPNMRRGFERISHNLLQNFLISFEKNIISENESEFKPHGTYQMTYTNLLVTDLK